MLRKYNISDLSDKKERNIFYKLDKYAFIKEIALKSLKKSNIQGSLNGVKIANNILIYRFSHPASIKEFIYQKESIKHALRDLWKKHINEIQYFEIHFKDLNAQLHHKFNLKRESSANYQLKNRFKEKACGSFVNKSSDPTLHAIFEKIRESIKATALKKQKAQIYCKVLHSK